MTFDIFRVETAGCFADYIYICNMRKERKETVLSETGKFLIDIAKLVFGGVILAGIMKYENINSLSFYTNINLRRKNNEQQLF